MKTCQDKLGCETENNRVRYYEEEEKFLCPACAVHYRLDPKVSCLDCGGGCVDGNYGTESFNCEDDCICPECKFIKKRKCHYTKK